MKVFVYQHCGETLAIIDHVVVADSKPVLVCPECGEEMTPFPAEINLKGKIKKDTA